MTPSAARRSPNGSWSPVGSWPMLEHAGERFELVGQRDRLRDGARGQRVARVARQVVLGDRVGDLGRFAVVLRVVAAHRALQLRKFADHVGDQIGLRQQRRAVGERRRPRRASGAMRDATRRSRAVRSACVPSLL